MSMMTPSEVQRRLEEALARIKALEDAAAAKTATTPLVSGSGTPVVQEGRITRLLPVVASALRYSVGQFFVLTVTRGTPPVENIELWCTANATYNESDGEWYRLDDTKASWALVMSAQGTLPGEEAIDPNNQCFTVWRAAANPGTKKIGAFAAYYGWELAWCFTMYRDLVVGGAGIEVDGAGTFPFGRFLHTTAFSSRVFTGIIKNLYADMDGGRDDATKPSWFAGIEDDAFKILRLAGSATLDYANFEELLKVSSAGVLTTSPVNLTGSGSTAEGDMWYDATAKKLKFYNGTAVETVTSST